MRFSACVAGAVMSAVMVHGASADTSDERPLLGAFRYADVQPPAQEPQRPLEPPTPAFASAGSRWWTVGAGIAHDFNGSTDTNLNFAYSYFLADNVEFSAEAAGWHFNQTGENTVGAGLSMVFRWHFINAAPWTVYADAGIGFLVAEDVVPEEGTSFDLTPRAGVGVTRALTDSGVRLQLGLRWHHISNARIHGEANNPARDQPLVYVGIIFPF